MRGWLIRSALYSKQKPYMSHDGTFILQQGFSLWWMKGRLTVPTFLKLQTLKIIFGVIEAVRAFVALILTAPRSALEVLDDRGVRSAPMKYDS